MLDCNILNYIYIIFNESDRMRGLKEGDVIERTWEDWGSRRYLIISKDDKLYSDPNFGKEKQYTLVIGNNPPELMDAPVMDINKINEENTQIIGNINENPELME